MRSKNLKMASRRATFFGRNFSQKIIPVRETKLIDLIDALKDRVYPPPNDVYLNAFSSPPAIFATQFLTAYGVATYRAVHQHEQERIAEELCERYSTALAIKLHEEVREEEIKKGGGDLYDSTEEDMFFALENKHFCDFNQDAVYFYNVLSSAVRDVRKQKSLNTYYRPSDLWEHVLALTLNKAINRQQLEVCQSFIKESIGPLHHGREIVEVMPDTILRAILLESSNGGLRHFITSDSNHPGFSHFFDGDTHTPMHDLSESASIIVPNFLLKTCKRLLGDMRVSAPLQECALHPPFDDDIWNPKNTIVDQLNANKLMHMAHDMATKKNIGTVVFGGVNSQVLQFPYYLDEKTTAHVAVKKSSESGRHITSLTKNVINFKSSKMDVATSRGSDSSIIIHANDTEADGFVFLMSPEEQTIHIYEPSYFAPLKRWDKLNLTMFFGEYSGIDSSVLCYDNDLIGLQCFLDDSSRDSPYSDDLCEKIPMRSYGWYDPHDQRFNVTDVQSYKYQSVKNDFLRDIEVAKGPFTDQVLRHF